MLFALFGCRSAGALARGRAYIERNSPTAQRLAQLLPSSSLSRAGVNLRNSVNLPYLRILTESAEPLIVVSISYLRETVTTPTAAWQHLLARLRIHGAKVRQAIQTCSSVGCRA